MKHIIVFLTALLVTSGVFAQSDADTIISNNPDSLKLKVFYFHITNRCHTCLAIEANVRESLKLYFNDEVKNGIIDLYVLNCEIPKNLDLVKKYQAYGSTLVLTAYDKGKETKTEDISNFAFQKAPKPELFNKEFKAKIVEMLK